MQARRRARRRRPVRARWCAAARLRAAPPPPAPPPPLLGSTTGMRARQQRRDGAMLPRDEAAGHGHRVAFDRRPRAARRSPSREHSLLPGRGWEAAAARLQPAAGAVYAAAPRPNYWTMRGDLVGARTWSPATPPARPATSWPRRSHTHALTAAHSAGGRRDHRRLPSWWTVHGVSV